MHHLMKKAVCLIMAAALFINMGVICGYAKPAWPADSGILAEAGILMDLDSGTVMYGQNIHVPYAPASITKLLTALVVAENSSMNDIVEFSHDAVYNVEAGSGNKLNLEEGDKLSVENCLYVLLLLSSNQSANALAEHVAGSREEFVKMMNDKIRELGCNESNFANPSGLNDDNQFVTAYDMALIARAAFENETVLKVSSSLSHSIPATINNPDGASFRMEHRILITNDPTSVYYCEGAVAGKTGYTSVAGNTLVTCASRNGRNLVSVVLKGKQPQYYIDAKTLLDFGFDSFKNMNIAENERLLKEQEQVDIGGVLYSASELSIDKDAMITLPATADFSNAERNLVTTLPSGHPDHAVAILQYIYKERKIGSAYIYAENLLAVPATEAPAQGTGADGSLAAGGNGEGISGTGRNQMQDTSLTALSPEAEPDVKTGGPSSSSDFWLSWKAAVVVPVLLALAAGAALVMREKKREREEMERRRARRRQRILESGCSEEEFETLLQERFRKREEREAQSRSIK